ncbi:hypothetical protein P1X14_20630 [Sphingomonas sp. AOB5]|uniref:hypothetical protein n=1 Tax=Sphingomonas sp. AOB5 TaxID=3034017 RepID=UPI0023F99230|nr:hypothetical protein [Sphingomonas sp. AOB5]MDF7777673.1 hypothetical protein [Sphingomonas sp. AOB5]
MIQFTWQQLRELYRRGFVLFLIAPVIVAIVVIPEFVQHIVEIKIGMFDSRAAGHALANDPQRWTAGYFKLAGLLIAMLATARYWGARANGGKWWRLDQIAWVPLIVAALLFAFVPGIPDLLRAYVPVWLYYTLYTVFSLVTLPLIVPIVAALAGDRRVGLLGNYWRNFYWREWRWVPLLLVLLVAAYAPGMALHYGFHWIAVGQPAVLLWPIMVLDSLAVGLIASMAGAAFSLTYEAARPASI